MTRQERIRRKIKTLPQDAAGSSEDDVAGVEDSGGGGVGGGGRLGLAAEPLGNVAAAALVVGRRQGRSFAFLTALIP